MMHKNETSNTACVRKWYIFSVHCTMFQQDRDLKRQCIIDYYTNADDGISCLRNPAALEKEKEKENEKTDSLRYNWGSENCNANDDDNETVVLHDDYENLSESFDLLKHVLCNLLNAHDKDADCRILDVENSCINTEET